MVTTNCREITGAGDCTVPISGGNAQELQKNVFKHALQQHADKVKNMSRQDQSFMAKRIEQVYNQKSGAGAVR
jgi:hypothetical protein